jgi:hypothetical protein
MVQLDIDYSRRMSLAFDLKIMLKTFSAIWNQFADIREAKKEVSPSSGRARPLNKTIESFRL